MANKSNFKIPAGYISTNQIREKFDLGKMPVYEVLKKSGAEKVSHGLYRIADLDKIEKAAIAYKLLHGERKKRNTGPRRFK